MDSHLQLLKSTLQFNGYSLTQPRRTLFLAMQNKEPLSLKELVALCPTVNRASIYRNLDLFERLDVIHRLHIGWKYKVELSESFSHHHHHLSCQKCQQVIPFKEDQALRDILEHIAQRHSYVMRGHQLEIQGICKSCLKS